MCLHHIFIEFKKNEMKQIHIIKKNTQNMYNLIDILRDHWNMSTFFCVLTKILLCDQNMLIIHHLMKMKITMMTIMKTTKRKQNVKMKMKRFSKKMKMSMKMNHLSCLKKRKSSRRMFRRATSSSRIKIRQKTKKN
jgi:hypothetical protein